MYVICTLVRTHQLDLQKKKKPVVQCFERPIDNCIRAQFKFLETTRFDFFC